LSQIPNIITIDRTRDAALIDRITAELKPYVTWDQAQKLPDGKTLVETPGCYIVAVSVDGVVRGLGVLNGNEVHTLFLENLRGKLALDAARMGLKWFFAHTELDEIVSFAFSHRPEVIMFAKLVGMTETNIEDPGFTYDGAPIKRHNFSIMRDKLCQ
jgi:hypothetical protein